MQNLCDLAAGVIKDWTCGLVRALVCLTHIYLHRRYIVLIRLAAFSGESAGLSSAQTGD